MSRSKKHVQFHERLRQLARTRRSESVGSAPSPSKEVARFRARPTLSFPPVESGPMRPPDERRKEFDSRPVVPVHFLGLLGSSANLPWHYTELVLQRASLRDRSFRDFLDLVLQQRPLTFLHAAWRKYRLGFALEEHARTNGHDAAALMLRSVVGLGTEGLAERVPEGIGPWVYFAGHFGRSNRSADGLEAMLEAALGHDVEVVQLVGRWRPINESQRTRIGTPAGGTFHRLGAEAVLGGRTWDVQSTVRVLIGPVTMRERERLITGRFGIDGIRGILRSYLGPEIESEIAWRIRRTSIEPLRLATTESSGTNLGVSSWLDASEVRGYQTVVPV